MHVQEKAPVNIAFSGSIPPNYDAHLGPLFFQPFAEHLADRIAQLAPRDILETACGTGRLTRQLDASLPTGVRITATDVNPAMLHFAQAAPARRTIGWAVVDAVDLPYPDASFDVVVAQFGVMFYSDRSRAYREALRVLRPGGTLLFTCWDRLEANPAAQLTQAVIAQTFSTNTPAFYSVPFAYHDRDMIREDVLSAGFAQVRTDRTALHGTALSARRAAQGLLEGSPIHTSIMDRDPFALPHMREDLTAQLAARFGATELRVPLSAWVVEARA